MVRLTLTSEPASTSATLTPFFRVLVLPAATRSRMMPSPVCGIVVSVVVVSGASPTTFRVRPWKVYGLVSPLLKPATSALAPLFRPMVFSPDAGALTVKV